MSILEEIANKALSGEGYAQQYVEHLISVLRSIDYAQVGKVIDLLISARDRRSKIFFLGNGGSAATASHFANDLSVCSSPEGSIPFRAISLTDNSAFMTCLANDFGYESIFLRQLKNLMNKGDVVIGISASGNSPNAVKALEYANENGGVSVAIVGFDGGRMIEIADHHIHVKTHKGEFGPVEDVHMVLDHLISTYLASVANKI